MICRKDYCCGSSDAIHSGIQQVAKVHYRAQVKHTVNMKSHFETDLSNLINNLQ